MDVRSEFSIKFMRSEFSIKFMRSEFSIKFSLVLSLCGVSLVQGCMKRVCVINV